MFIVVCGVYLLIAILIDYINAVGGVGGWKQKANGDVCSLSLSRTVLVFVICLLVCLSRVSFD